MTIEFKENRYFVPLRWMPRDEWNTAAVTGSIAQIACSAEDIESLTAASPSTSFAHALLLATGAST